MVVQVWIGMFAGNAWIPLQLQDRHVHCRLQSDLPNITVPFSYVSTSIFYMIDYNIMHTPDYIDMP